jgi:hypothetical protein
MKQSLTYQSLSLSLYCEQPNLYTPKMGRGFMC